MESDGALFEPESLWQQEWKGMPEFKHTDQQPFKSLIVHFENAEDIAAFAKLVGQSVNVTTRSIWYPEAEIGRMSNKVFLAPPAEAAPE